MVELLFLPEYEVFEMLTKSHCFPFNKPTVSMYSVLFERRLTGAGRDMVVDLQANS